MSVATEAKFTRLIATMAAQPDFCAGCPLVSQCSEGLACYEFRQWCDGRRANRLSSPDPRPRHFAALFPESRPWTTATEVT